MKEDIFEDRKHALEKLTRGSVEYAAAGRRLVVDADKVLSIEGLGKELYASTVDAYVEGLSAMFACDASCADACDIFAKITSQPWGGQAEQTMMGTCFLNFWLENSKSDTSDSAKSVSLILDTILANVKNLEAFELREMFSLVPQDSFLSLLWKLENIPPMVDDAIPNMNESARLELKAKAANIRVDWLDSLYDYARAGGKKSFKESKAYLEARGAFVDQCEDGPFKGSATTALLVSLYPIATLLGEDTASLTKWDWRDRKSDVDCLLDGRVFYREAGLYDEMEVPLSAALNHKDAAPIASRWVLGMLPVLGTKHPERLWFVKLVAKNITSGPARRALMDQISNATPDGDEPLLPYFRDYFHPPLTN